MSEKAASEHEDTTKQNRSIFKVIHNSPLILWLLPIIGTYIAICVDIGVLNYYDIPSEYAEINPHTIYLSTVWVVVSLITITVLISIYGALRANDSLSNRILTSFHVFPFPLIIGIVLYIFGGNLWLALSYAGIAIIYILLPPLFVRHSSIPYQKRVENRLDEIEKSIRSQSDNDDSHFANLLFKLTWPFFVFLLLTAITVQIGYNSIKGTSFLIVKNQPSTLALKRNNDLYILKKYDQDTLILHQGFTLKKLDAEQLELEEVRLSALLKSKNDAAKEAEKQAKKDKFASDMQAMIRKFKDSMR